MAQQEKQTKEKINYVEVIKSFLSEVSIESKKVVWPNRETLTQSSMTVLGSLVLLTVIMAFFQIVWAFFFDKIL